MRAHVHLPRIVRHLAIAVAAAFVAAIPAGAQETVKLGLVAAMSGQSAKSGEAIVRGLSIAIDEINAKGGLLGKKVELIIRDDESNPAKGAVAARELVQREKVAALFGGLDTPVSLAIVPFANQTKVPFMGVWAAGTPITRNGAAENYAFRVSAVDELVDNALVDYSVAKYQVKKPGMILINNPWGESNEKGLKAALAAKNIPYAGIEKFETNDVDVVPQLTRLKEAGADALYLVANVAPSSQVVKSLDRMGWNVPIVSHWGPAGGRFSELAGPSAAKVHFIQTYSFSGKLSPKGEAVLAALKKKYPEIKTLADVTPAVGIANAYDAMHLTGLAIAKAGSLEGAKIRQAFYAIDSYDGLIKSYARPFTPENQDALGA
ncbi:MAG TPA: ABC transporter substrate-binding protein, partial [Hyphomicrobiaceae bacterium]|nr:ABC transporter substrate-binding protein [Hyphomicrobiaceae bacterium]